MSIRQRWLLFGGLLVLLSIVALRASMPTAMSAGLRAWLEAQGASDVFVGEIRLRLLDGQLELDGLSFTAGGEESRVGSTRFELAWSSTDTRRLWLKRIAIDGLRTRIAIADDGSTTLAGLLPSGNKDATDAGAFVVMVDEANLSDGEIVISHRGADHRLRLDAVTAGFGITPEAAAAGFSVRGDWNGIPARITGVLASDATRQSAQLQIDSEDLRLDAIARELEALTGSPLPLAGTATLKAALSVTAPMAKPARLLAATDLRITDLAYRFESGALTARTASWLGQIEIAGDAVAVSGELDADAPGVSVGNADPASATQWNASRLGWQGTLHKEEQSPDWRIDATVFARDNLVQRGAEPLARVAEVRSTGTFQLRASLPDYDGDVALTGLTIETALGPAAGARVEAVQWTGKVQGLADGRFNADGALSAKKLSATRADDNGPLIEIGSVRADGLQLRGETIASRAITLADLAVLPNSKAASSQATLQRIGMARMQYAPGSLQVAELTIDGLDGRVIRNADGHWLPMQALASAGDKQPTTPGAAADSAASFATRVDRLRIDEASRIEFEDRAVTPPHRRVVRINKFSVDDFNSASSKPARIDVAARIDEHAEFAAGGTWHQAAGSPETDLKLTVRRLELPPLTGYSSEAIAQTIISGQLDADTTLTITGGKLNADNALTLRRLELKAGASDAGGQADRLDLGMPLDTALRLLRDRKGDIRLQLPVRGTLTDPKFEIRDALRVATRNAMQYAAISYIKHAIQPFGTLVTLAELGAAGLNAAIRLDPMRFSTASASFDQRGLDYLERLAAMLAERPKMQLRICGKASSVEFAESVTFKAQTPEQRADTLLQLAQSRAEAVKRALIDVHGVGADRLFVCQPETGDDESLAGRVDLLV